MADFPSKIWGFIRRHKRKFIFAGVFIGGVAGLAKYAEYKVKDWVEIEKQKSIKERQKLDHFNRTEQQCKLVIKSVIASISDQINSQIDINDAISQIKFEQDPTIKISLWNDLKIKVFTKVSSNILLASYCVVIISVQLCQISAKIFSEVEKDDFCINPNTQKWYLALCHDFVLKFGLPQLLDIIEKVNKNLLESMPLQCPMTPANIENTLNSIKRQIEDIGLYSAGVDQSKTQSIMLLVFPTQQTIDYGNFKSTHTLNMMNEVWDIFDSNDFRDVLEQNLLTAFSNTADLIAIKVWPTQTKEIETCHKDVVPHTSVPLAKLLPIMNKQLEFMHSDEFIDSILTESTLSDFRANVFESFIGQ